MIVTAGLRRQKIILVWFYRFALCSCKRAKWFTLVNHQKKEQVHTVKLCVLAGRKRRSEVDDTKQINETLQMLTEAVMELTLTIKNQLDQIARILAAE